MGWIVGSVIKVSILNSLLSKKKAVMDPVVVLGLCLSCLLLLSLGNRHGKREPPTWPYASASYGNILQPNLKNISKSFSNVSMSYISPAGCQWQANWYLLLNKIYLSKYIYRNRNIENQIVNMYHCEKNSSCGVLFWFVILKNSGVK